VNLGRLRLDIENNGKEKNERKENAANAHGVPPATNNCSMARMNSVATQWGETGYPHLNAKKKPPCVNGRENRMRRLERVRNRPTPLDAKSPSTGALSSANGPICRVASERRHGSATAVAPWQQCTVEKTNGRVRKWLSRDRCRSPAN
jgi:hypothetical protein